MRIAEIMEILDARVLAGGEEEMEQEVESCIGSDMMSDVLAFARPGALIVTGLTNSQSVRTADMADAAALVYIRDKRPGRETLELAERCGIPLLATKLGMFDACAALSRNGLKGIG